MASIILTPSEEKVFNKQFAPDISCAQYTSAIKSQMRVIEPLDVEYLKNLSRSFNTGVVLPAKGSGLEVYQAMTFSVSELLLLISSAGGSDICKYIRVYNGIAENHLSQFVLPVDNNLDPIISANVVCVSDLPCPPRTNCPNDVIVKEEEE